MEKNKETKEEVTSRHVDMNGAPTIAPSSKSLKDTALLTTQAEATISNRGTPDGKTISGDVASSNSNGTQTTTESYVYALGRVEARFPSIGIEKEFAQATGRAETAGLTDREALYKVLSQPQNRYLIRLLCWVVTIEGMETYILQPLCPGDLALLVEALRPAPRPLDVDVIIGVRGPLAPPDMCNGLMVPMVIFDQMYSFDVDTLIKSIPRPEKISSKQFESAAEELFMRIMQMADNAGAMHEHRALNYLAVRYHAIYAKAAEAFGQNSSLTAVEVRSSPLSEVRKIVEVIFSFTNRQTDVTEKFFVRVDVTEMFPFLVTKISPYYDLST